MSEEYNYKDNAKWTVRVNLIQMQWPCDKCGKPEAYWSEIKLEELPEGREGMVGTGDKTGHTRARSKIDSFWHRLIQPLFLPLRRYLPAGIVSDWEHKLKTKAESVTKKAYLTQEQKDYAIERCWEMGPAKDGSVKPKVIYGELRCDDCVTK